MICCTYRFARVLYFARLILPTPESEDNPRPAAESRNPIIDAQTRARHADLVVGLADLIHRNRLALIVLAASLASGARHRARLVSSESAGAIQWLARNARSVREFIASLCWLRLCAGRAGYRALARARTPRRLSAAPRILRPRQPLLLLPTGMVNGWESTRLSIAAPRL